MALFAIPLVLGLGASVWLGVWMQAHYFLIDRNQEQRIGQYVAAPDLQRSPYIVTIYRGPKTSVDKVDIHNGQMTVLFHNFSGVNAAGLQIHWQWVSPDGTKLSDDFDWVHQIGGPSELGPGEKGILTEKNISPDPRAAGIGVWVTSN